MLKSRKHQWRHMGYDVTCRSMPWVALPALRDTYETQVRFGEINQIKRTYRLLFEIVYEPTGFWRA